MVVTGLTSQSNLILYDKTADLEGKEKVTSK